MKMGPFLETVASGTCLGLRSVRIFGRELRDGGLLTTGARGVNAPDMTPRDLAVMLIALLGTDRPARAVDAVRYFGGMQPAQPAHPESWGSGGVLPESPDHTLLELLTVICDPAVELPQELRIALYGNLHAVVSNDAPEAGEPLAVAYHDRIEMDRLYQTGESSLVSGHGIQTTREIGSASIEAMKTAIFERPAGRRGAHQQASEEMRT